MRKAIASLGVLGLAVVLAAQTAYQPKFKGDPARSDAEFLALGYLRPVIRAQNQYKKMRGKYATSLMELAGHGSFTKRMAKSTDRGDYVAHFRPTKDGYSITLIPKQFASDHRAFYAEEDGKIRVEEDKPAGPKSPLLK
jgi:hypothetical protein